jgi:hypothetical protein
MQDRFGESIRPEDLTVTKPTETAFSAASPDATSPANSPRRGILRRRRKEKTVGTGIPMSQRSGNANPGVAALADPSSDEWVYCSVAIFETSDLGSATIQARKLAKLAHPRVIRLLGLSPSVSTQGHGGWLVVTEAAALFPLGEALMSLETRRQLTLAHQLLLLSQVSNGMEFVASMRMAHCHITLNSVVLCTLDAQDVSSTHVKLKDFDLILSLASSGGSSADSSRATRIAGWVLAPETLAHHLFSLESDVWTFGILVWQLFTAGAGLDAHNQTTMCDPPRQHTKSYTSPYGGENDEQVRQMVLSGRRLSRPRTCPRSLWALVASQCWSEERAGRPSFARISTFLFTSGQSQGTWRAHAQALIGDAADGFAYPVVRCARRACAWVQSSAEALAHVRMTWGARAAAMRGGEVGGAGGGGGGGGEGAGGAGRGGQSRGGGVIILDIATARNVFLSSLKAMCNIPSVRCLLGAYVVLVMVVRKLMRDAPELQQCQAAELGVSVGMQRLLVIVVSEREREKERESESERDTESERHLSVSL